MAPAREFVFQPKHAACLNLIEPWWEILRSLVLKGRRFETWEELGTKPDLRRKNRPSLCIMAAGNADSPSHHGTVIPDTDCLPWTWGPNSSRQHGPR